MGRGLSQHKASMRRARAAKNAHEKGRAAALAGKPRDASIDRFTDGPNGHAWHWLQGYDQAVADRALAAADPNSPRAQMLHRWATSSRSPGVRQTALAILQEFSEAAASELIIDVAVGFDGATITDQREAKELRERLHQAA